MKYTLFSGGILSHTFELEAKAKGLFAGSPAVIKFRVPTKSALQVNICCNCCLFLVFCEKPFSYYIKFCY